LQESITTPAKKSLKNIVILISGRGSNMEVFLEAATSGALAGNIVSVISNRPDAQGIITARNRGIATTVIDHQQFAPREAFDAALADEVAAHNPDVVVLAGFMRILTPVFINRFLGKLVNIHPSLLPKYAGLHTHQRAIDAGDKEAGATVHYVTNELDGGPAILQARVNIANTDDAQTLACKVLEVEHLIFPEAVNWHLQGRVVHANQGAQLDGELLPPTGAQWKHPRGE
jgi:phosphoribosylglycinamide formyltransferase-1